ncbi:MAG: AMP nucleosidase [Alphaproteobacteria bacterium]
MKKASLTSHKTAVSAFSQIEKLYKKSLKQIQDEFLQVLNNKPLNKKVLENATYPCVQITVTADQLISPMSPVSYGIVYDPGTYSITVTRPDLFKSYYLEQLESLIENHGITIQVGKSHTPIPMLYAVEDEQLLKISEAQRKVIEKAFPPLDLRQINDNIANSMHEVERGENMPLALFTAPRVDYSLDRLYHYTGTDPKHFQRFILLTNYQRYVDAFIEYAQDKLKDGSEYTSLVGPGGCEVGRNEPFPKHCDTNQFQMPAYHLKGPRQNGITFINIGVGPSNAKTITDHLAVLRPHCWIMVGHCAGLRHNQMLGDYVLAHAYVRDDRVLDQDVPSWVPIPSITEIQQAMTDSIKEVTGLSGDELKVRSRTGTVASTCDRNWELNTKDFYVHLRQSRAIAVDMESATIATNGFRFRVPYGTLLCVSDKPVHGEIKMRGMANVFYQKRVQQHLRIGLHTIELLKDRGVDQLHSRKLRGFFEVPFG